LATIASAVLGCVLDLYLNLGGFISQIASFGLLFWLLLTPHSSENVNKRLMILLGFGLCEGLSLGKFVEYIIQIDSMIIFNALLGTLAIFASFSLCAIFAESRSYLFLGGILFSSLSFLSLINFINIFVGNAAIYDASLYIGLFIFSLFIIFDTQMIIEKNKSGSNDFISHSLELFLDMIQVFVRLAIILSKREKKRNSESR